MGRLSEQEARQLEALQKKREAPDPEPISRSVRFNVDLGKKDQLELARKLGLLNDADDGDGGEEGGEEGDKGGEGERAPDKAPRRGGYFG